MDKQIQRFININSCHYGSNRSLYEALAYRLEEQQDIIVHVVLGNVAKSYFSSLNQKLKTDKADAKSLGQMGVERELRVWKPTSKIYQTLRILSREREQLIEERTMIKNQLHAKNSSESINKKTITRSDNRIKFINNQISIVEKDLEKLIKSDDYISKKLEKIITVPGVGFIVAVGVIAETSGFSNITSISQLSSYSGYDVVIKESGKMKGKSRISKKGNSHIRRLMHMASLSTVRYSEKFKNNYERINTGKEHKLTGLVAVQRKVLGLMYTLWKNDTVYIENYDEIKAA